MNTVAHVLLSIIIPLYAYYPFWRLKKLQKGLIITAIFSGIPFGIWYAIPTHNFIFLLPVGYFFTHSFPYFTYRWCRSWNKQIDLKETTNSKSQNPISDTEDKL